MVVVGHPATLIIVSRLVCIHNWLVPRGTIKILRTKREGTKQGVSRGTHKYYCFFTNLKLKRLFHVKLSKCLLVQGGGVIYKSF